MPKKHSKRKPETWSPSYATLLASVEWTAKPQMNFDTEVVAEQVREKLAERHQRQADLFQKLYSYERPQAWLDEVEKWAGIYLVDDWELAAEAEYCEVGPVNHKKSGAVKNE